MFRAFTVNPTIAISFNGEEQRATKKMRLQNKEKEPVETIIYAGQEAVSGMVDIVVPAGKKVEHLGIKIEMIGHIELYFERGTNSKFVSLVREIEAAGIMGESKSYPFDFSTEKPYESYSGLNVRLRYFVRVTISRSYGNNVIEERDFAVQNVQSQAAQAAADQLPSQPIKMEVGIEDCLHIEFEFNKGKYHLKDVILGKIYFLLVRIKIKHMELAVIRREAAGFGANNYNDSENIIRYELMDGAPVKGECVPIRLFLSSLDLTPTYRSVNNVFSVKYYLNLVLIDEEDRRYFKQQEVVFWRKGSDAFSVTDEENKSAAV
jgi:vacuolar protein sorting-associated protein 26